MKINIYYGGRGLIDDPTLYVINKMEEVFKELRVTVERYQLCDLKNSITTLPQSLKDVDGIILASTVEWHGIGGYMHQFLDACWLYGNKEKISQIYMCPIVMSTTYGEREGKLDLATAWEILGGLPCSGICGYIEDISVLENDEGYNKLIETKAENMYRTINKKLPSLPASNQAVKRKVSITKNIDLTPQESEQLSYYASDDSYVQKTKEDIKELTSIFRERMEIEEEDNQTEFLRELESHFNPIPGFHGTYKIGMNGEKQALFIEVNQKDLICSFDSAEKADVEIQMTKETMDDIIYGRMSFQRAFMSGMMKMKGEFKLLRQLDQIFVFREEQ
ncbi:MAG: SCP2 sterol-binding domain-containing protein [Lachnospiraceae bacterium]